MAGDFGRLSILLDAQTAKFRGEMRKATAEVKKTAKDMKAGFLPVRNLLPTIAVGALAKGFADTAVEASRLKGQLKTATGSAEAADVQFQKLKKFATETPFSLRQTVEGFVKLKNLGLDPSEKSLRSYGNTASAMGKDLNQMIEAVADASTMEFERLKEFGIKAKQQADTVSFTFRGVTTVVEKEAGAITEFLTEIGENEFGMAMADQMEGLPGKISNLTESWKDFQRAIVEDSGLVDVAIDVLSKMTDGITAAAEAFRDFTDTRDNEAFKDQLEEINEEIADLGLENFKLAESSRAIKKELKEEESWWGKLTKSQHENEKQLNRNNIRQKEIKLRLEELEREYKELMETNREATETQNEENEAREQAETALRNQAREEARLAAEKAKAAAEAKKAAEAAEKQRLKDLKQFEDVKQSLRDEIELLKLEAKGTDASRLAAEKLNIIQKLSKELTEEEKAEIEKLVEEREALIDAIEKATGKRKEENDEMERTIELLDDIAGGLGNIGRMVGGSLGGLIDSFGNALGSVANAFANPSFTSITGAVSSVVDFFDDLFGGSKPPRIEIVNNLTSDPRYHDIRGSSPFTDQFGNPINVAAQRTHDVSRADAQGLIDDIIAFDRPGISAA